VQAYWSAFLALFVAVDIVGVLPVYLGFVATVEERTRRRIVVEATLTAAGVGGGFLFLGDAILHAIGVSVGDFQVAGGLLLLVLALYDLLHPELPLRQPGVHLGAVPLGTPLIIGPAVLTTLLTLARSQGYLLALLAFGANLVLVWAALRWASVIVRAIGNAGARAVAKVFELLLAAIGVTLVRRGLELALQEAQRGLPRVWG
jgi:multiple antibiotic resistance protein